MEIICATHKNGSRNREMINTLYRGRLRKQRNKASPKERENVAANFRSNIVLNWFYRRRRFSPYE